MDFVTDEQAESPLISTWSARSRQNKDAIAGGFRCMLFSFEEIIEHVTKDEKVIAWWKFIGSGPAAMVADLK